MNHNFINMIRIESSIVGNSKTMTSVGIVTGYDPVNFLVTVELYPQDNDNPSLQTGWIPLFSPWIGNGFGVFFAPNIGDIIEVHYQEGSLQNAYAGLRSFNFNALPSGVNLPAGGVPSGECWIVHETGSIIKLTNDGKVSITSNIEIDIIAPIVNVSSPSVSLGNGSLTALLTGAAAAIYNGHTHLDSLHGLTSAPSALMSGSDMTSNTTAS